MHDISKKLIFHHFILLFSLNLAVYTLCKKASILRDDDFSKFQQGLSVTYSVRETRTHKSDPMFTWVR